MFLQRLSEYVDRVGMPPILYAKSPIRYIIELDAEGRLLNPEPTDTADPTNPRTRRGVARLVPRVQRTSALRPLLLSDNAEYTLGLPRDPSRAERCQVCHQVYMEQLEACARRTEEPSVSAVLRFLRGQPLAALRLPERFDAGANVTFRIDGTFPVDLQPVQDFWAEQNALDTEGQDAAPVMPCVVCGRERPALRRLKGRIKGIPGGQPSGTAIISANADAFYSYGLRESLIAPTCATCGERFTYGLNSLLADRVQRAYLGGAVLVFWTRQETSFSLLQYLNQPQPGLVTALLEAAGRGGPATEPDPSAFYAAVLSGSGGRAVVRDWIDTTVGEVKRRLADWFDAQRIVGAYGEPPRPLGIYALAATTVRDVQKELPPGTPQILWRAALTGTPLPPGLLYQAVRRNRAEQGVTRPRAALIKLVLATQHRFSKEDSMVTLDRENPSPAYLCGRLLAVIEEAQRLAVPGAKATVVDRFFGTASSAPASVFGRLLRGAQPHLSKLQRDRPGAYWAIQRRLEEVQAGLAGFPRVLTLEEQGLFALGYYHQRAEDRSAAIAAAERKRAGLATPEDDIADLAENRTATEEEE
jgi:CRISPR-associated protein Csd1